MKKMILLLAFVTMAGCTFLSDCPKEVGKRDVEDVKVFLNLSGVEQEQFCKSQSLRVQYDKWAAGMIGIDGNATRTRQSADSAAVMSAMAVGMAAGKR